MRLRLVRQTSRVVETDAPSRERALFLGLSLLLACFSIWTPARAWAQWPGQSPAAAPAEASPAPATEAPAAQTPAAAASPPASAQAPEPTGVQPKPSVAAAQTEQAPTAPQPPPAGPATPPTVLGAPPSAAPTAGGPEGQPPPEESDSDEEAERRWLPWMASLAWSQGYAAAGLFKSTTQTFNPTYSWAFLLTAGYNFDKDTALTLNQYAVLELTDSDTTNTRQELFLYDTSLDASHNFFKWKPATSQELTLSGAAGLVFPTSKTSRAATLILGTRARVSADYAWKRVLHGFVLSPSFSYQRRWNSTNTLTAESPFPCALGGLSPSLSCPHLGSVSTSRDVFLLGLDGALAISDHWFAGASFTFWWILARSFATEDVQTSTGIVPVGDQSLTHSRNTRWLLLSFGYKVTDWFSVTARVTDIFSERGMAGQLRGPFNPIDTVFGLELAMSFDRLYLSTQAHGASER